MSKTPRTDAQTENNGIGLPLSRVDAGFARELERENASLKKICMGLESEIAAAHLLQSRLERENARLREDKRRLDGLEEIPYAIEIVVKRDHYKSDSVPSLRSQIDYFLQKEQGIMAGE